MPRLLYLCCFTACVMHWCPEAGLGRHACTPATRPPAPAGCPTCLGAALCTASAPEYTPATRTSPVDSVGSYPSCTRLSGLRPCQPHVVRVLCRVFPPIGVRPLWPGTFCADCMRRHVADAHLAHMSELPRRFCPSSHDRGLCRVGDCPEGPLAPHTACPDGTRY